LWTRINEEDSHCYGRKKDLIFVTVIGIFVKRGTVPTRVVQYSFGLYYNFRAWLHGLDRRFPYSFCSVPKFEPRPGSAGWLLQATNYYSTKVVLLLRRRRCCTYILRTCRFYAVGCTAPSCGSGYVCQGEKHSENTVKKTLSMGIRTPTHHQEHL